jgi:phosphomannomutase
MKAFHAYDIRGVYNRDFNKDDVYKIGFFLPELLKTNKILVGRDVRVSSPEIFEYLCNGITDAGADVHNIGLATTPMVYFGTANYGFEASVQITASHNSKEYNGLKVSMKDALPVGYANGLGELEKMVIEKPISKSERKGEIIDFPIMADYIAFQKRNLKTGIENLSIGLDCSNGMASILIKDILGDLPHYIYDTPDGTFPNHEPNPLVLDNVKDLSKLVIEKKCDIGVIFDGDADRVMFTDENGKFISPDLMIALMGHYFLDEKSSQVKVLQDIRSSKAVGEYLAKFGAEMHTWRVGRAFAAHKLREIDGLFGGELAGHYYFKDFFYSDSGILACLIILQVVAKLKKQGLTLSQLIAGIEKYNNSGEINFKLNEKKAAMEAIREKYIGESIKFFDFDGYRLEFEDWWFNVRPSNTEPYLRLIVEAISENQLKRRVDEISTIIKSFA